MRKRIPGALVCLFLTAASASASGPGREEPALAAAQAGDNAVLVWDEAVLHGIRITKPGPTIVARALAVAHSAMFDAWSAYDERAVPTVPRASWRRPPGERTETNKAEAVSYAGYRAVLDLFPSEAVYYRALLQQQGYAPDDQTLDLATARGVGNAAAAAVLDVRHRDGSNQLGDRAPGAYADYTGYVPVNTSVTVNDPNRWQPLALVVNGAIVTQTFTTPQWGLVTPFALPSGSALRPPPPPQYPDPQYKAEADEVLAISASLTDAQKVLAEYFADGPNSEFPPGHWALFGQFVSRRDGHSIDDDAKMFFALGNALLDASIAAWDAKRAYDFVRPYTAIHFLYRGQLVQGWGGPGLGTVTMLGETWRPYQVPNVVTPPFPEFFSGHSVFSATGAQILASFTGSDAFVYSVRIPAGSSAGEPGLVPAADMALSWNTFSEAADAAGMSRRYGGIHFRTGDLTGRAVGRVVGALAWSRAVEFFEGRAYPAEVVPLHRSRTPRLVTR
ncbi:MAG: vanadium-dependent haloperoxidase [Acidobacteriota bacterium]|nr:vanadium-dependent haloperoxidase [Acidobacteriota bacterium]